MATILGTLKQYSTGQKTKKNEQQEKIQKLYVACTIDIQMSLCDIKNTQLLKIPLGIQILVMRQVESATG